MELLLAGRLVTNPGSWVAWVIVGLIAGAVAARVVTGRGFGCLADIIVGIVGALIGGWLISPLLGGGTINQGDFSVMGLLSSLIGAIILLAIVNLVRRGRPT